MASIRNSAAAASGTTSAAAVVPAGLVAGDALYMLVEAMATTPNADPCTTPSGWTKLAVMASGTATTDTTLTVFGKISVGASEPSPVTVSVTGGDHITARMTAIYGHSMSVITDTVVGADNSATTGATATALGITVADQSLVLVCATTGRDLASTTNFATWTNTNLVASLASPSLPLEIMDTGIATGLGGGLGMAWGNCLGTTTGNSTVTIASSTDSWCAVQLGIPTDPNYSPGEATVTWTTPAGGHYMMAGFKALTAGVPITEVKKAHAFTPSATTTLTVTWDGGGVATAGNLLVALVTPRQSADISPVWTGSTGHGSGRGGLLSMIAVGGETGATITVGANAVYSIALWELAGAQATPAAAFDVQGRSNFTSASSINFGTPGRTAVDEWFGATVGFAVNITAGTVAWDAPGGFTEYYEDIRSSAASKIVPGTPTGQPTLAHIDGYEHQSTSILRFGGANNTGVWTTVGNAGGISFPAGRTGGVCLRVAPSASTTNAYREVGAATGHRVGSIYFRINQAPTGTVDHIIDLDISPSGCGFRINNNGTIEATALGVGAVAGPVVTDNAWHRLDFYVNTSANPWVVKWTVDGVAQTDKTSTSQAASTVATKFGIGFLLNQNNGMTLDFDDFVYSNIPADYPIGAHKVLALVPNGDGTHVAGTNTIEDNAGTDLVSPNGFGLVDDWPAVTSPYIQQVAVGANNYAEVTFPDTSETTVWGAQAIAALFANSTTASATATTQIVDSANAKLLDLYSGDMSETSLHYRSAIVPSLSTVAKLNGLKARAGFATVVTSVPRWSAVMIEYAVPEVATTPITAFDTGTAVDTATVTTVAFTRVQTGTAVTTTGTGLVAPAWPVATTAGNLLIAVICTGRSTAEPTLAVPGGSPWVLAVEDWGTLANEMGTHIYYIANAASRSGAESSFTLSVARDMYGLLLEYSGAATAGVLDAIVSQNGAGVAATAVGTNTSAAIGQAAELLVGAIANANVETAASEAMGGTATGGTVAEIGEAQSANGTAAQKLSARGYEYIATGAGTAEFHATLATARLYTGSLATFKATGGPTTINVSDSAVGSDDISAFAFPALDSASAADTSALTTAIPATDAATAIESIPTFAKATTDVATAGDVAALLTADQKTVNDSATASDTLTGRALALADSGAAADVAIADTGLVDGFEDESFQTDAFQSRPSVAGLANIVSTLGALTQAATATTNIGVFGTDAATASDLVTAASRPVADTATSTDTAPTLGKTVADSATGADAVSYLDKVASDAATGADASLLTAALPVTDSATGVESIPTLAKATTDTASGADASALTTTVAAFDSGVAADTSLVPDAALPRFDSATAADTAAVTNVPQNLIAVAVSTNEIDLTWDVFSGAVAYDIERDGAIIAFDVPTNAYDDLGLSPDTLYVYRVRAVL